jgi:hypothetical protein
MSKHDESQTLNSKNLHVCSHGGQDQLLAKPCRTMNIFRDLHMATTQVGVIFFEDVH